MKPRGIPRLDKRDKHTLGRAPTTINYMNLLANP
jgi:hypothetical protein